jgi:hypothetical protein
MNFAPTVKGDDLSLLVNALVDEAMEEDANSLPPQGKGPRLGPSMVGGHCVRKTAYDWFEKRRSFLAYKSDPEKWTANNPFPGRILRRFALGNWAEEAIAGWLVKAGFDLSTHQPTSPGEKEWQYSFWLLKDPETGVTRFGGFTDGIIRSGPIDKIPYPCVWENKVMNLKNWHDLKQKGLKKSHQHYYAQVQLYMGYSTKIFGEQLDYTLFTSMNTDTMELHCEVVRFNEVVAQKVSDEMVQVILSESPDQFARVSEDPSKFPCGWCDHRIVCHGLDEERKPPEWLGA